MKRLESLRQKSYVPYSKAPHAARFIATNGNNATRQFIGVSDDNASYGASALAETVANARPQPPATTATSRWP